MGKLRVKICGLMQLEQALAIVPMGADALGFICVPGTPRYLGPEAIALITAALPHQTVAGELLAKIGVFADASIEQVVVTTQIANLTGVQLHGQESVEYCAQLRQSLPQSIEIIKALRVRTAETLDVAAPYQDSVDGLLLDAYAAKALGGTGETWDWSLVERFQPNCPWFLAGGLNSDNILEAIRQTQPNGVDLSSGVEKTPGNKDLQLVQRLFQVLKPELEPNLESGLI